MEELTLRFYKKSIVVYESSVFLVVFKKGVLSVVFIKSVDVFLKSKQSSYL